MMMHRVLRSSPACNLSRLFRNRAPCRLKSDNSGAFADRARVVATGGHGGAGCVSFSRGPNREVAPPDGGNGGDGGHVWLEACDSSLTLRMSTTTKRAENGQPGMSDLRRGRTGKDLVVQVPAGTVAYLLNTNTHTDPETGEETTAQTQGMMVCDLDKVGNRACVARGGRGGRGNSTFKASTNRSPETSSSGAPGETSSLLLELKMIADIGLVGLPNAGKSTFLRAVSAAKPRVASYAFTTLRPHIGVVKRNTNTSKEAEILTIADIPGLIEDAHLDRGLGHEFLRHVERTKALVYVVDVTGSDTADDTIDPITALRILEDELEMYSRGLSKKVCAVVANKLDKGPQAFEALNHLIENVGDKFHVFPTVASDGSGVEDVVQFLLKVIREGDLERRQRENRNSNKELGLHEARDLWLWEERATGEFDDMRQ